MEDKLVSLETAKLAKKKEFNEICQYYYEILDKPITLQKMSCSNAEGYKQPTAPTQSLLQKWLREKYKIIVSINIMSDLSYYSLLIDINENKLDLKNQSKNRGFNTYEEALELGLQEALKLI